METNGDPSHREVDRQLKRILASVDFQASERLRAFLGFVVHETLAGRGGQIKGYTIATQVFGRPQSFDPTADPVVRIQAGRLRRRLDAYYHTAGVDDQSTSLSTHVIGSRALSRCV